MSSKSNLEEGPLVSALHEKYIVFFNVFDQNRSQLASL